MGAVAPLRPPAPRAAARAALHQSAHRSRRAPAQDGLRNAGPDPKRFTPAEGQIGNLATAAFPFLLRLGSGGFASGYSSGLKTDDGSYSVAQVAGRSVGEYCTIHCILFNTAVCP